MVAIPVYLRHSIIFREGSSGRFDVTIGPKQTMGKSVSNIVFTIYEYFFAICLRFDCFIHIYYQIKINYFIEHP